jgi:hypothetical protein
LLTASKLPVGADIKVTILKRDNEGLRKQLEAQLEASGQAKEELVKHIEDQKSIVVELLNQCRPGKD